MGIVYRCLRCDESDAIRLLVARHQGLPRAWDPEHEVRANRVAHDVAVLSDATTANRRIVVVASDEREAIVALHWVALSDDLGTCAMVQSLWTDPSLRRRGIARELKRLGEEWARSVGATTIATNVAPKNREMILLNETLGFCVDSSPSDPPPAGYVRMTKAL